MDSLATSIATFLEQTRMAIVGVDKREKEEQQMTERLKSSQEGRARLMYLMYLSIHDKANKIVAALHCLLLLFIVIV